MRAISASLQLVSENGYYFFNCINLTPIKRNASSWNSVACFSPSTAFITSKPGSVQLVATFKHNPCVWTVCHGGSWTGWLLSALTMLWGRQCVPCVHHSLWDKVSADLQMWSIFEDLASHGFWFNECWWHFSPKPLSVLALPLLINRSWVTDKDRWMQHKFNTDQMQCE